MSDISTLAHHVGTLVVLVGLLMCVPLAVALLFGELASAADFVYGIGVCLLLGASLRLFKAHRVDRRCSLLLTGLSWIVVGLVAAIPMFLSGGYGSFVDALFDSVSSVTTTGVSLSADLDAMSRSQVVWHAVLTLAGGQAVLFIAVYFGFSGEGSFASAANTRGYSDLVSSDRLGGGAVLLRLTLLLALVGTLVAFVVAMCLGLSAPDAAVEGFALAANAANTGGFVPHASSLVYYHCAGLDAFLLALAVIGGVNIGILTLVMKGKYRLVRDNSELRMFLAWTTVFVVCVAVGLSRDAVYTTLSGLLDRGLFTALAAVTTSGMQTVYPEQLLTCFSDGVVILIALAVFFGACACSTAGGVKMLRLMEVMRWLGYTIFRAILPDSARLNSRYNYFGHKNLTPEKATHAMTIVILYLAAAALGAMAFIAYGNDALASILESISYVSNDGMTAGITGPDMPLGLKLVAVAQMWGGRLEFIALVAALAGIAVSLRPLPDRATARERRARKERVRKERKARGRRGRAGSDDGGSARAVAVALCLALAGALAAAPLLAQAAGDEGPEVPASQVEGLKSQEVESYRTMEVADLLGATERLEGRRVSVRATACGTRVNADAGHCWLNVKSGGAMIGVYASDGQAEAVETYGGYDTTGDTVVVRGVYHRACAEHDGELDVHADELAVAERGHAVTHKVNRTFLALGVAFCLLGVAAVALKRFIYGKPRRRRLSVRWL